MEPFKIKHETTRRILITLLCLIIIGVIAHYFDPDEAAPTLQQNKVPPPTPDAAEIPVKPKPVHLSKHVVEYHIGVTYDVKQQTLHGEQSVTWTNPGKQPVSELYFHLYPNAFQSMDTTFMQESGGKLRNSSMKAGSFASMNVSSIQTLQGEELNHRIKYIQPDDGNKADRSLMKLRLPAPVLPGEKITLRMKFDVTLPHAFARMGAVGDYVMAGQWFPKIAVYEPAGTRNRKEEGWHLHQYHGNSEFYSDFGIYNVKINVPDNYIVAATGFPAKPAVKRNGMKTYHFYADDVHDFAWAASPHFIYAEESFSDKRVPGVKIKLYLDPQHESLKERYMRAAKQSLSRYSEWYGAYPYSTLSIIVPPEGAGGTAGMEYPTLITAWEARAKVPEPDTELERVIAHEIAHQYWYGMVASNEMEEPWLDEAFTSYSELKLMQTEYDMEPNLPMEAIRITEPKPLVWNSWGYKTHSEYAENVYTRGKLVLLTIERDIGSTMMDKVLRTYFQRWKFKHPSTSDFQKTLEEVTKKSWTPFFNQFVNNGSMLDYEVNSIDVRPVVRDGRKLYENVVRIIRHAGHFQPVPIIFYFQDGTVVDRTWHGNGALVEYKLTSDSPLAWTVIDPEHDLIMENKHYNNILQAKVDRTWKIRWNLLIGRTIESLLGWVL